jgi:hypothetical protein
MERWEEILPNVGSIEQDLPALALPEYDHAVEKISRALETTGGVRAAACFGQASLPGVSDLDVLVLCDDAQYEHMRRRSAELQEVHSDVLKHQMFVLPASFADLRPILFFEQTFNPLRMMIGDASLLASTPPSLSVRTLSTMTWGSTVWRVARYVRSIRSKRLLLLFLQTVARQSALTAFALGEQAEGQAVLAAWKDRRKSLVHGTSEEVVHALADALEELQAYEWKLQKHIQPDMQPILSEAFGLRFRTYADAADPFVLPAYYARLCALWAPLIPSLNREASPLRMDLEAAFEETVLPAIDRAVRWSREQGDPYLLFLGRQGIFPSPFNALPDAAVVPTTV